MRPGGPRREWPETVLAVIRELSETMRSGNRRERMRRFVEASADHYRHAGEPEPEWIAIARRLAAGEEGPMPERGGASGDVGVLELMIGTVPPGVTPQQHREAVTRLLDFYERLYADLGAEPPPWVCLGRERFPRS